jgi:hypothetical protein
MPLIPLTGSVAHLYSSVPTVVDARKGVKEKYEFGEMTVTTISASVLARFQREHTVIFGFISFPDPSAHKLLYRIVHVPS